MIDVMFFLLVTFMLASLSMQSLNSIAVNLPKGNAESMEHQEPITLTVTHDSKIFIDKTPTRSTNSRSCSSRCSRPTTWAWW